MTIPRSALLLLIALAACSKNAASECGTGSSEPCIDAGPDSACPIYSVEYCDGQDNDCNGVVDDAEACPDPAVTHTEPLTTAVYLLGTTNPGSCESDVLQRFWPTPSPTLLSGFQCLAGSYRFRRSDNALYYRVTFSGIHQDIEGPSDIVVPTPPCGDRVRGLFDFDAAGTLYYQCDETVLRSDGVVVAESVHDFVATLDDGRAIVTRGTSGNFDFVVLDASGNELSRLSPFAEFVGTLRPAPQATTVIGNRAYVAYLRDYPGRRKEIVVFQLDERSTWRRVRRASVPDFGDSQLVLSDGTVLVREQDSDNPSDVTQRVVAFPPDRAHQVIWREVDQPIVRSHIGRQLLTGPL